MTTANQGGRPSDYTPELADKICALIAEGNSLRTACAHPGIPKPATIFRWLGLHREFKEKYEKAQQERSEAMAEEILEIADDKSGDPKRDRLRVDTRKWLMSKLTPKKYGDKVALTDGEGGPLQIAFKTVYESKGD